MALKNTDVLPVDAVQGDASFFRQQYLIEVPRRFTLEQVLDPEWFRLQTKFRVNDEITLLSENGSFDVTCRVVQADRGGYCVLRILRSWFADADAIQSSATGEPRIELCPGRGLLLFGADGSPVAAFSTEDSAKQALLELPPTPPAPDPVPAGEFVA